MKKIEPKLKERLRISLENVAFVSENNTHKMHSHDENDQTNIVLGKSNRNEVELKYLGQSTKRSSVVGSPVENQLLCKAIQPAISKLTKKLLQSRRYGSFMPSEEINDPNEQISISESATDLVHDDLTNNPEYVQIISDIIRSTFLYPITCIRSTYRKDVQRVEENYDNVTAAGLQDLQNDQNYNILEVNQVESEMPTLAGLPTPPVEGGELMTPEMMLSSAGPESLGLLQPSYSVQGERVIDRSKTKISLVPYYDMIVDNNASSVNDIMLIGEQRNYTKKAFLAKYDPKDWEGFKINEYFDVEADDRTENVIDCHVKVEMNDKISIYHVIAIRDTENICFIEDVGLMPYQLIMYDNIPNSLSAVSVAERIIDHEGIVSTLLRSLTHAALESSHVQKVVVADASRNLAEVVGKYQNRSVKVVANKGDYEYAAAPFPGDVLGFMDKVTESALELAGTGSEFDPPSASNVTLYESILRDENASSVNDYRLTILANAMCRVLENNYQLMVKYADTRRVYDPRKNQIVQFDLSRWPSMMQMLPVLGFGRGQGAMDVRRINSIDALIN